MIFLIVGTELIVASLFCLLAVVTRTRDIGKWVASYLLSVPLVGSLIIAGLFLLGEPVIITLASIAIALIIFYTIAMFVAIVTIASKILSHQDYCNKERNKK